MALFFAHEDPYCFEDAVKQDVWKKLIEAEITSIEENNTWELVDLPREAKIIGVRWIFKTKFNEKGGNQQIQSKVGRERVSPETRLRFL